jgi:phosphomannomutase
MITASHNPKDDNGYKAYWSNGAQILSPHDKMICELKLDLKGSKRPVGEILIQVLLSSYWLEENTVLKPDLQMLFSADGILEKYYENESSMSYYKFILNKLIPSGIRNIINKVYLGKSTRILRLNSLILHSMGLGPNFLRPWLRSSASQLKKLFL